MVLRIKGIAGFLYTILLFKSSIIEAQQSRIRPLQVGDRVPDISFHMLNYPNDSAKISDFRGKLLILDFWNTHCLVCLKQFPKLKRLQEQFGDSISIIAVGFDGLENGSVKKYYNKVRGTDREIHLPIAIQGSSDTILSQLFPSISMPHEIWIAPNGTVCGITDHRSVREENIRKALRNSNTFQKPIEKKYMRPNMNFLINRSTGSGNVIFGSVIARYIDSLLPSVYPFGRQFDSSIVRLFIPNNSIINLYKSVYRFLYKDLFPYPMDKHMIVEDEETELGFKLHQPNHSTSEMDEMAYQQFKKENYFNYELILPKKYNVYDACEYMIQDLDRYFGINSRVEKKTISCYSLIRTSTQDKVRSVSSFPSMEVDGNLMHIKKGSIKALISYLNRTLPYIIVNETNYEQLIDISLPNSKTDLDLIKKSLLKYDLDLRQTEKTISVLILSSSEKNKFRHKHFKITEGNRR